MQFSPKLRSATFLRRYKRFLVDVRLDNGEEITVHCPNTGRMTNCLVEGSPCWLSDSQNPKRKYRYSLEWVTTQAGYWAGVNTHRANALVIEAIQENKISALSEYDVLATEMPYGEEKSRIDILLSGGGKQCYVEVKSVTLEGEAGVGYFPDAVSTRGQKHLRELIAMKAQGHRAVLFFCVQHTGIRDVRGARHIDPLYASLLAEAVGRGVEVIAYGVSFSPEKAQIVTQLVVSC